MSRQPHARKIESNNHCTISDLIGMVALVILFVLVFVILPTA
jgi:hypothetical protein